MENEDLQLTPRQEVTLKEIKRKAFDSIRLFNPTDEDYQLHVDKTDTHGYWLIPNKTKDIGWGKGQRVVPRYAAELYKTHMVNNLINKEININVEREVGERKEKSGKSLTPLEKQDVVASYWPTNEAEKRTELIKQIWLGVEEVYGYNKIEDKTENEGNFDTRPLDEQLSDALERPAQKMEFDEEDLSSDDLEVKKTKLAKEISNV